MRGSVIVLIILMLNIVSNAQDWIEKDGIEYNCAVVLSILGDYGDESLTRQSGLQGSVEDYFEGEFPTCSHPIAELATAVPESIESEDEDHLDDTPAQDAGDGCYPYDDAIVTRHTTIKASYGFTKATVGQAKVGDTFEVTGSKRYGAECWVTTNVGWLFGNYVKASANATLSDLPDSSTDTTTDTLATQDICYPYADAIVTRDTTLRLSPSVASPHDDSARVGDTFKVFGSKHSGSNCWVETNSGWLIDTFVTPSVPSPALPSSSRCYEFRSAYVTGVMNIRESYTTASQVVRQAHSGDVYKVTGSHQGDTWCWLQISNGWMANTSYVSHDISHVLPPIRGEDWFKDKVVAALEFLSRKSARWFSYTAPKITMIEPDPDLSSAARVIASTGRVKIASDFYRNRNAAELASTLVHEACHVHQWQDGKRSF